MKFTIDESVMRDHRFIQLIVQTGCLEDALGGYLAALMMAEKYWIPDKWPIPMNEFLQLKYADDLLQSGLCRVIDNGDAVYLWGSEEQFEWFFTGNYVTKRQSISRNQKDLI